MTDDLKNQIHTLMERGIEHIPAAGIARGRVVAATTFPARSRWRGPRLVAIAAVRRDRGRGGRAFLTGNGLVRADCRPGTSAAETG